MFLTQQLKEDTDPSLSTNLSYVANGILFLKLLFFYTYRHVEIILQKFAISEILTQLSVIKPM